jgi:sugar phosphate isomerase/epimerase
MFNDYFVRMAFKDLYRDNSWFYQSGLKPEIYLDNTQITQFNEQDIFKAAELLSKFPNHTIHAPFIDISPGAFDKDVRRISLEKLKRVLTIAKTWKTFLIVMHFNYDPIYYSEYFDLWLKNAAEFYRELLSDDQIPWIALENICEPTPMIALKLSDAIAHPKVIHCLDVGHHHVFSSLKINEWLYYLHPSNHIHFHFHDNCGKSDDHLPIGKGTIDWTQLKKLICQLPCSFSIALEPHSKIDTLETIQNYKNLFLKGDYD